MSNENKIIGLDGRPAAENNATPEAAPEQEAAPQLSPAQFNKIAGAFAKLQELAGQKVATPTQAAEIAGTKKFLLESFLVFGPELLGCYDAVRSEYEPMLKTFAQLTSRVGTILANVQAARAKQAEKSNPTAP